MCVFLLLFSRCFPLYYVGRISKLRFPRDPVLYILLQVLFRMLRWLAERPVHPPSISLPTSDGGLGTRTWLDSLYIFRWYFSDTFLTGFSVLGVGGRLPQSRDWSILSIYTLRQLRSISLACNPALIILRAGNVLYFTRV